MPQKLDLSLLEHREYAQAFHRQAVLELKRRQADGGNIIKPWLRYPDEPVKFCTHVLKQLRERSWWPWRVIIKATFGEPLNAEELVFFRKVAQRDPPKKPVRELWCIVGRRGGKDSVASMLAVEAARRADCIPLRPGERSIIACLAQDRDHAGIVFNYIKGYFEEYPHLMPWVVGQLPKSYRSAGIQLSNRTEIRVTTNNYRAPRGFPIPTAIFDEVAFWRDENYANPDVETYRAMRPGMSRYPNPLLIGISTPYRKSGLLWRKYQESFGKEDDRVLVIQGETRLFHEGIDEEEIQEDMESDPSAAKAEWYAQFRDDLEDYVPSEIVQACTVTGRFEIPYEFPGNYIAFTDPSGGSRDSFTLAIAHKAENTNVGILDLIYEIPAPFVPTEAVAEMAGILRRYNISTVIGDNYAGEWPKEAFQTNGIMYEVSELHKSQIYKEALPLFRSRLVELLENRRLFNQLVSLERRTARGGRDIIDHPPNALDDVANCVCGALVGVTLGWSTLDTWIKLAG